MIDELIGPSPRSDAKEAAARAEAIVQDIERHSKRVAIPKLKPEEEHFLGPSYIRSRVDMHPAVALDRKARNV